MTPDKTALRPWRALSAEEQLALRRAYQGEIDKQPLTCSLEEKTARFTAWLNGRGVGFSPADIRPAKH